MTGDGETASPPPLVEDRRGEVGLADARFAAHHHQRTLSGQRLVQRAEQLGALGVASNQGESPGPEDIVDRGQRRGRQPRQVRANVAHALIAVRGRLGQQTPDQHHQARGKVTGKVGRLAQDRRHGVG